jgi:hypothetical protein
MLQGQLKEERFQALWECHFPERGTSPARIVMGLHVGAEPAPDHYRFRFFIPSLEFPHHEQRQIR